MLSQTIVLEKKTSESDISGHLDGSPHPPKVGFSSVSLLSEERKIKQQKNALL